MRYKLQIINRENLKVEAVVGELLTTYYAELLEEQTRILIDTAKYQIKIIPAF